MSADDEALSVSVKVFRETGPEPGAGMKGKVHSPQHRGLTPERRAAISLALTGKTKGKKRAPLSPEHRAAISRGLTPEIRAAISLAQKMSRWTCITCSVTGRPPLISRWHSKPGCVIVREAAAMNAVDPTTIVKSK